MIKNPFIENMMKKNEFKIQGQLDPFKVAFYIVPFINATIRIGISAEKEILFKSLLEYKAYSLIDSTKRGCKGQKETIVEQACRNCTNIKNRQSKEQDKSLAIIEQIIQREHLLDNKILTIRVPMSCKINKNLTGLIANKLMAEYQRPVLLLNEVHNLENCQTSKTTWEGSGRAPGNMRIENFRDWLNQQGLVLYAEGHPCAFGVGIADNCFDKFIVTTNALLADFDFSPCYKVDAIFNMQNLSQEERNILKISEFNSIWGQGIEKPLIAIENVKITSNNFNLLSPDKSPSLKITCPRSKTTFIKFGSSKEEYDNLNPGQGCVTLNIIGTCECNIWNGNVTPQIIIQDYEVINRMEYYF